MPLAVNTILFDELTADPSPLAEGMQWYHTTEKLFKIYRNGTVTSFTDKAAFEGHSTSTSNPHTTTLEQARTANATLAGNIAMGTNIITGLGAGSATTDAAQRGWVTDQINQKVRGLEWQDSVLNRLTDPPVGPVDGDRYLIKATAGGIWTGKENQVAQYDVATLSWLYGIPNEGWVLRVEVENLIYTYDGATWGNIGNAVDHAALLNLTVGNPHTQYQLGSEKNQANGYCGLDGSTTIGDSRHGARSGGTLHTVVSSGGAGFAPQSNRAATTNPTVTDDGVAGYVPGSHWLNVTGQTEWVCISNATGAAVWVETTNTAGVLKHKAGHVLAAGFAGNPKKATVTFSGAFADANYAVTLGCVTQSNTQFNPCIESQVAGSFVINMGVNNITNLLQVNWHATKDGEST